MNLVRWIKNFRYWLFYRLLTRRRTSLLTLGDNCKWTFCENGLGPASRVLCGGAGHDISFEKAIIARYGCHVVLVDPSPTGIATVDRELLPSERFTFLPVGLAAQDGAIRFREPADANEGSFVGGVEPASGTHEFPCQKISTLMAHLGWKQIDLLKIDIEGFEYGVLDDLIQNNLWIRQVCVEFHHGPQFGRPRSETVRMILAMRRAGYDLVHHIHSDHTFLRRNG